jgi:hypothetical protein
LHWFTDDTLGLTQGLANRIEVPPLPYLPVYKIGYNAEWLSIKNNP